MMPFDSKFQRTRFNLIAAVDVKFLIASAIGMLAFMWNLLEHEAELNRTSSNVKSFVGTSDLLVDHHPVATRQSTPASAKNWPREFISLQHYSSEPSSTTDLPDDVEFTKQIQPVFEKHCLDCHGPNKTESRFRVDRRDSFINGGDYGEPMVIPGKPNLSRLIPILKKTDPELQMPPEHEGLSDTEIKLVKRWIELGAKMPTDSDSSLLEPPPLTSDHWSLQKVEAPEVPSVTGLESGNPIDQFIGRKLEENGLSFSTRASRSHLIRRLYLVMLGVPPTPAEVNEFVGDQRADAWQRLVSKILDDSRYGERWAQHWLDIVRFGESDGFETNRERPNAWRYRDWVIQSLNEDKPYDQFVKQQIAGDAFGEPLGTGFLVAGPHDIVKSPDINLTLMQRQDELADIVNTTGTTFLGLTIGCARCHDHKFDPVTQTDFFSLQAVFAGVQHGERELPIGPDAKSRLSHVERQIADIESRLLPQLERTRDRWTFVDDSVKVRPLRGGFESLRKPEGIGTNPPGKQPGHRDDAGSSEKGPNLSGGSYSWWKNQPGKNIAVYHPKIRGQFRVWASWGLGYETHTQDARYLIDQDGNLHSQEDQLEIAVVDQQRPANSIPIESSPLIQKPLWSGLQELGTFEFGPTTSLVLRSGETGTAITADLVAFELIETEEDGAEAHVGASSLNLGKPISSSLNVENFPAVRTQTIRFEIAKANRGEPCIDELEIIAGGNNVALEQGFKLSSSGNYPDNAKHKLSHLNDGITGNSKSWISNSVSNSWVQVDLARPADVEQIVWARDRSGTFSDRVPSDYEIKALQEDGSWVTVASSKNHLPTSYLQPKPIQFVANNVDGGSQGTAQLRTELTALVEQKRKLAKRHRGYVGTFSPQPGPTHRLHRGDPMAKREEVAPDTIRVIGSLKLDSSTAEQKRRIALAEWVANKNNPLTSRVIVNRLWQFHFGEGIVSTPSDFGGNGTAPTHPELLDWLANDLMVSDWSLKSIHRKILLSKTWQQSSAPDKASIAMDAGARLLWRFPPRRLEAEAIRDSMVNVSGVFNPEIGGPGFSAFEVQMENVRHYFPKKNYDKGDWRRMVYMTKIRQERESTFGAFDCPDGSQVTPSRSQSTTPLQALNLFNSKFVLQQAELFAKRLEQDVPGNAGSAFDRIQRAYQLCYSRNASQEELEQAKNFIQQQGLGQFCRALLNSNEFLFIP